MHHLALVEIVLGNGRVLRVRERIDPAVLARLAATLDRRYTRVRGGEKPSRRGAACDRILIEASGPVAALKAGYSVIHGSPPGRVGSRGTGR